MTFGQAIIGFIIVFICFYSLVSRICNCIERCRCYRFMNNLYDSDTIKTDSNNLTTEAYTETKSD